MTAQRLVDHEDRAASTLVDFTTKTGIANSNDDATSTVLVTKSEAWTAANSAMGTAASTKVEKQDTVDTATSNAVTAAG